ncbi:MAG: MarC family protein [Euryarchaeota archaeon]|nr:MarC family protein [Euryarchaeota archaeon]
MVDFNVVTFFLYAFTSLIIIVNPIAAMTVYTSLTSGMEPPYHRRIANYSCRLAFIVLLFFTLAGSALLDLFGISVQAFTIAGGILLLFVGFEMVNAKTSRTKLTSIEKYQQIDPEEVSSMPLAFPMIAGPGSITTVIVLSKEIPYHEHIFILPISFQTLIIILCLVITIVITWLTFIFADKLSSYIREREYRVLSRLMGIMLMAIAVQFMINGLSQAFPGIIQ